MFPKRNVSKEFKQQLKRKKKKKTLFFTSKHGKANENNETAHFCPSD